jgi:Mg2+ and Co2+ transporter CorA
MGPIGFDARDGTKQKDARTLLIEVQKLLELDKISITETEARFHDELKELKHIEENLGLIRSHMEHLRELDRKFQEIFIELAVEHKKPNPNFTLCENLVSHLKSLLEAIVGVIERINLESNKLYVGKIHELFRKTSEEDAAKMRESSTHAQRVAAELTLLEGKYSGIPEMLAAYIKDLAQKKLARRFAPKEINVSGFKTAGGGTNPSPMPR